MSVISFNKEPYMGKLPINIQVIIMSYGSPMTRQLQEWLRDHKLDWRYGPTGYGIDLTRNQLTKQFLQEDVPLGKTHLLCVDHDMIPLRETRHILRGSEELIYCGCAGRHGSRGHIGNGDLGASCLRVSADLLQRMAKDGDGRAEYGIWWKTTAHNGVRIECECEYFRKRAEAAGAISKMVGIIGHEQTCILIPLAESPGYEVLWAEELERKKWNAPGPNCKVPHGSDISPATP